MSTSEQRLAANRANAQKSTGPKSKNGKAVACLNATRHGLLSSRLLLDDEEPTEFQRLLAELDAALRPHGAVELVLLERIAVTIWRQRRLVSAEAAALRLSRQLKQLASGVSEELDLTYGAALKEEDIAPFDSVQSDWCRKALDEIEALEEVGFGIELRTLPKAAPLVFAQLVTDADEESAVESFLADHENGLKGYVTDLASFCRKELSKAEQRPHILVLADQLQSKRLVLPPETLELFSRYQTTLDNQLYKALRTFREAQDWRLKTLDLAGSQTDMADLG